MTKRKRYRERNKSLMKLKGRSKNHQLIDSSIPNSIYNCGDEKKK